MSWNIFGKSQAKRITFLPPEKENQYEKLKAELEQLEKLVQRLHGEIKRSNDSFQQYARSEQRICAAGSEHCSPWPTAASRVEALSEEHASSTQAHILSELRRLNTLFSEWRNACKHWDAKYQECMKQQQKVDKGITVKKGKDPQYAQDKLSRNRAVLETATNELLECTETQCADMQRVLKDSGALLKPLFDIHASMQHQLIGSVYRTFSAMPLDDDLMQSSEDPVRDRLVELRSLAIVSDSGK